MKTRTVYVFTVEGQGSFPFDMLRYDHCWPRSERDSSVIHSTVERFSDERDEVHKLTLTSELREPTAGRWISFGWKVVESRKESY